MSDNLSYSSFEQKMNHEAEKTRTPISVAFELTGRCNFDCKMCYVHTMDNCEAMRYELSTEQWKSIFDEAFDNGMMIALLSGGECLLRPDFKELFLYLRYKGVRVNVNTNGLLLTEEYIDFFKKYHPDSIQVTLYGTNDDEYDTITGKRVFSVVSKNIDLLAASGLPYWIALTPCSQAKAFFKDIMDYAYGKGYNVRFSELLIPSRENVDRDSIVLTAQDYCDYFLYRAKLTGKSLQPLPAEILPEPGTGGDQFEAKYHCTAGRMRAAVNWKGEMYPCLTLSKLSCSVLKYGFVKAWENICKQVDELKFPDKCSNCAYKNNCKPCYALRCSEEDANKCNESVCELTKLKVQHGLSKPKFPQANIYK